MNLRKVNHEFEPAEHQHKQDALVIQSVTSQFLLGWKTSRVIVRKLGTSEAMFCRKMISTQNGLITMKLKLNYSFVIPSMPFLLKPLEKWHQKEFQVRRVIQITMARQHQRVIINKWHMGSHKTKFERRYAKLCTTYGSRNRVLERE